jgi:hypothetical protein
MGVVEKAVKDRTNRDSLRGLKQAKALVQGSSANKTKKLLKLNRNKLRWVLELPTGH